MGVEIDSDPLRRRKFKNFDDYVDLSEYVGPASVADEEEDGCDFDVK